MSHACTPILVDVTSPVLEILLLSKMAKFPFRPMVHGSKGNLAVFESSNISKTGIAMPTKIDVHAFDINPYLHKFFGPIPIN